VTVAPCRLGVSLLPSLDPALLNLGYALDLGTRALLSAQCPARRVGRTETCLRTMVFPVWSTPIVSRMRCVVMGRVWLVVRQVTL
jgi:hypothetical protein